MTSSVSFATLDRRFTSVSNISMRALDDAVGPIDAMVVESAVRAVEDQINFT
jgi:hypothetical protein